MRSNKWRLAAMAPTLMGGLALMALGCGSSSSTSPAATNTTLPAGYDQFGSNVQVARSGDYVVIQTTDVPDHKSPYFAATDSRYEAYNGANPNFQLNPNRILIQQVTLRIPATPTAAANPQATPLGPIGVALNGVLIFNQYAGPGRPLTNEIDTFDQYDGHPQQTGQYHYHVEPTWLTGTLGKEALLGFLLDGFPVYGPMEGGANVANADLDAYHGHLGPTAEYPNGIYHYHVTGTDPYINGSGFYGTPGTVSN